MGARGKHVSALRVYKSGRNSDRDESDQSNQDGGLFVHLLPGFLPLPMKICSPSIGSLEKMTTRFLGS